VLRVESSHGWLEEVCLAAGWIENPLEAHQVIAALRKEYIKGGCATARVIERLKNLQPH
jgi:hypothetical protein